jgi:hypothetical protein
MEKFRNLELKVRALQEYIPEFSGRIFFSEPLDFYWFQIFSSAENFEGSGESSNERYFILFGTLRGQPFFLFVIYPCVCVCVVSIMLFTVSTPQVISHV